MGDNPVNIRLAGSAGIMKDKTVLKSCDNEARESLWLESFIYSFL